MNLPPDEVHVWQACLQVPASQAARLYDTLSPDERERADRYRFVRDRQRFVAARAWLRAVLSMYLGTAPIQVRFSYNPHGKPELDAPAPPTPLIAGREIIRSIRSPNPLTVASTPVKAGRSTGLADTLHFNLSHSDDLALYALTRGRRVGIDLERLRPGFADDTLAASLFSPREVATLRSLPASEQEHAFFTCWTRKEAYLKARGEGLIIPLDSFDVSLAPGEPAALLQAPEPAEAKRWLLRDLDIGPHYVAALAVEGRGWELRCRQAHRAMLTPTTWGRTL